MKQDLEGEEKRMKAKAYLEQARNINIQIDSKLEQVSALRQLAIKASSTLSPVPPSGTPQPAPSGRNHRSHDGYGTGSG